MEKTNKPITTTIQLTIEGASHITLDTYEFVLVLLY